MKESLTQEDHMGCGAACVAFTTNTTYKEATHVLGAQKAKTTGYHLQELVDGLESFGLTSHFRHIRPKDTSTPYRSGAIVFIKRSKRYPYDTTWRDIIINGWIRGLIYRLIKILRTQNQGFDGACQVRRSMSFF